MRNVTPSTHLIAYTHIDRDAERQMLDALGAPEDWHTDATDDASRLTEVMGRLCYKSFGLDLNPNLTRVREGNEGYVGNILSTKHGSVLEHATATIGFIDVSPVVTHELVRHRAGTAFSQVSMRFVRLTEIGFYMPQAFGRDFLMEMFESIDDATWAELKDEWAVDNDLTRRSVAQTTSLVIERDVREFVEAAERLQLHLAKMGCLDRVGNFNLKKRFTSSMRRLAPYGLATSIGVTANHRAWRFMIAQRTHRSAEEEIRLAFGQVAEKLAHRFPNLYQDMRGEVVDGFTEYTFDNHKV